MGLEGNHINLSGFLESQVIAKSTSYHGNNICTKNDWSFFVTKLTVK